MVGVLGGLHSGTPVELKARLEEERRARPFLVFRDGEGAQRILGLPEDADRVTLGRRESNDVALPFDTEVSRVHAELCRVNGEWCLVDDGLSRNGSYVNRERVSGRLRLRDGDIVRLGRTLLLFRAPAAQRRSEPTAVPARAAPVPAVAGTRRSVLIALCRPLARGGLAPATNLEIADELALSVQAVKANLRALFGQFGVDAEPQNRKRLALARAALDSGALAPAELEGFRRGP